MLWNWRSCWKAKPGFRNTFCRQAVRINGARAAPRPCDIWSGWTCPVASAHPASPSLSARTQHLTPSPRDKCSLTINTWTGWKLEGAKKDQAGGEEVGKYGQNLKDWTPDKVQSNSIWGQTLKHTHSISLTRSCFMHHLHWNKNTCKCVHFVLSQFQCLFSTSPPL